MAWLSIVKKCPNTKIICKDQNSNVFPYLFGPGVGGGGSMFLRKSLKITSSPLRDLSDHT